MKYSKNGQNFQCYLRHAEHHAHNHTSLHGLDHETLFLNDPLHSRTQRRTQSFLPARCGGTKQTAAGFPANGFAVKASTIVMGIDVMLDG